MINTAKKYFNVFKSSRFFLVMSFLISIICFHNIVSAAEECSDYPDQFPFSCIDISLITLDYENSATEINNNSSGTLSITGGSGHYTWMISGENFSFNPNTEQKRLDTSAQTVDIHANDKACGSIEVTISDGCSTAVGYVRSKNGRWVNISQPNNMECLSGGIETTDTHWGGHFYWNMETPKYKQRQGIVTGGSGAKTKWAYTSLSCDKRPTPSEYQAEADAWCDQQCDSIQPTCHHRRRSGCTASGPYVPVPYCADSVLKECKAVVGVYNGNCAWGHKTKILFYCNRSCVSIPSTWSEYQCSN